MEQGGGGDSSENMEEEKMNHQGGGGYDDLISTLPKEKASWMDEALCLYQGFWLMPSNHLFNIRGIMNVQQHFKARPSDVLLTSLPKSGTTWLKSILFAIMNRNSFNIDYNDTTSSHPLLTTNPHDCVPFLEILLLKSHLGTDVDTMPSPRLFATHIPYSLLPESVTTKSGGGCRIVYVCRDPKDVFVSMFHFISTVRSSNKDLPSLSFEESFDLFCKGLIPNGPSWEHVVEYHQASMTRPDKVLFLKYEDMQTHTMAQVKRVAEFLGQPFSSEEESNGVVKGIIRLCSFEKQANLEVNMHGTNANGTPNNMFYRKGTVGDSKNHLTIEMIERIDQITHEKFGDLF